MRLKFTFFVLLLSACGLGKKEVANPFGDRGPGGESANNIRITVENRDFNEANLFVIHGVETRVGRIQGNGTRDFQMVWPVAKEMRIRIRVLAGGSFTTNPIHVSPGERVYLFIDRPLNRSRLRR